METSFLIGSGFSVPADYPTVTMLNSRLEKVNPSEVVVHTDSSAFFTSDPNYPNSRWMGLTERQFIQEFLEFYNTEVLADDGSFHYETFYDYYLNLWKNGSPYPERFTSFLERFRSGKHVMIDDHNLLFRFNNNFHQLVAGRLRKPPSEELFYKPYLIEYRNFLNLVEALGERGLVHLHSLNHDTLLERLAFSESMKEMLDDGFQEQNSPFFGELRSETDIENVQLDYFADHFESPFRLYKLHGSVDYYWYHDSSERELIKLKWGMGRNYFYKKVEEEGETNLKDGTGSIVPEFLSGTTAKITQYDKGTYYPVIFRHFTENLNGSKNLIVIGYGFGDAKINEYIETSFLTGEDKRIFIVDIRKPNTSLLLLENVFYISGGVTEMDTTFIMDMIHEAGTM